LESQRLRTEAAIAHATRPEKAVGGRQVRKGSRPQRVELRWRKRKERRPSTMLKSHALSTVIQREARMDGRCRHKSKSPGAARKDIGHHAEPRSLSGKDKRRKRVCSTVTPNLKAYATPRKTPSPDIAPPRHSGVRQFIHQHTSAGSWVRAVVIGQVVKIEEP